ncbi:MAG: LD-carboxypeptidase [Bacteroidetes bacterium]|nr:LD-carboxypeptidase [Bacteroidota bacterium]
MSSSTAPRSRRDFLQAAGAAVAAGLMPTGQALGSTMITPVMTPKALKPPRLKQGDTVGLVNPAGITYARADLDVVAETLAALGLAWKFGDHVSDRYGYLAGADADRAADINGMFADPGVNAVMAIRGGWGCNRILHLLDYDTIVRHPKILVGYSDITSLLLACNAKTGLVTFHGPVGVSTWNNFSVGHFRRVLMDAGTESFRNPRELGDNLTQTKDRIHTITPGKARGILLGGNLSVLAAMIGSPYLPAWERVILFLEDDGESIYRVDRMLTHLRLAGILDRLAGFVFGKCTDCGAGGGYGSLTLEDVFRDLIAPLGIPAFSGAMIGHIENKFTVPLGIEAEIDATEGSMRMLESAVL